MRSSLAVSPSSSRPVGMPVQAATTSAISSGPTSSRTIGSVTRLLGLRRPARARCSQLGDLAVQDLAGRGRSRRRAEQPLGLRCAARRSACAARRRRSRPAFSRCPPALEPAQLLLAVGEVGAQPLEPVLRGRVVLAVERELLHLHPVHRAPELVDLDRARSRSPCAAGTRPRRPGRSPCRAAGGR